MITTDRFDLAEAVNARWPGLSQAGLRNGRAMTGVDLFGLLFEIERLRRGLSLLFESYDLILTPAAVAMALPIGLARGLPVGMQLIGREGNDNRLLAVARQYESAHGWQRLAPLQNPPS